MSTPAWWLAAAVVLALAELVSPGMFLAFIALAAGITALLAWLFPDLSLAVELAVFAAWSVLTVMVGRRWYRDYPVATSDPLLNDRAARLVGELVTVVEPIDGGRGRVRIGDGEWPASGPDLAAGARAKVVRVDGGVVVVESI